MGRIVLLTATEYLDIERDAHFRSEFHHGRMYAMSGGSIRHALVGTNIASELRTQLRTSGCSVASSDLRVATPGDSLFMYPDVVVFCGEAQVLDQHQDTLLNPILLIEVLSPSTEGYDRGFKSQRFRTIASLREYALVSQSEARVELFRRREGDTWSLHEFAGLDAVCRFESTGCSVTMAEIYRKITFAPEA